MIFLTLNCTKNLDEGKDLPQAPTLFGPPADMEEVERGIDAIPNYDGIQLDWHTENSEDIAEYIIYRRTAEESQYQRLTTVFSQDTTYIDLNDIEIGKRYYYFIVAVDYEDRESANSDTVDYMLVAKAFHLYNSLTPFPTFRWEISEYPAQYVLKLFDAQTSEKIWFSLVPSDYTNQDEQVDYNSDGTALIDSLSVGHTYMWRVDVVGTASNSGSESNWKQFTVDY
jgi:hypothetical protein